MIIECASDLYRGNNNLKEDSFSEWKPQERAPSCDHRFVLVMQCMCSMAAGVLGSI